MRYCIGDIHGCAITLGKLIDKICTGDSKPEFYFVGDFIDRGPDSKAVIDYIIELINKGRKVGSVRGNHEEMLILSYKNNYKITGSTWYLNGAEKTIKSFNPKANLDFGVQDLIPEKYYQFLLSLPYYIELEDYLIVHAGFNFKSKSPFTDFESMLWTRKVQNLNKFTRGKKIIHGHTPISFEQIKLGISTNNIDIINIDSGCVYTNRETFGSLTALNMDTLELLNIKNTDL